MSRRRSHSERHGSGHWPPRARRPGDVTYKIEIKTCDLPRGGTGNDVEGILCNGSKDSGWHVFDRSGYNDFEQNDTDTYEITVPADFGHPTQFEMKKYGFDDWCFTHVYFKGDGQWANLDLPRLSDPQPDYWITRNK
ncbi:PLAT/LH2 domain-containing protein [Streptomyces sp. NBC_00073]|uniref:PLAT/LH2 domain-containing protein n=1 Tax=Streptomyces sp. NBC_00073 TaxID=2975640 RepID=UPI00386AA368